MIQREGASSVLVLAGTEDLAEILSKIREHRTPHVLVSFSAHSLVRESREWRRLLRAAARDLGKELAFQEEETAGREKVLGKGVRGGTPVSAQTPSASARDVNREGSAFAGHHGRKHLVPRRRGPSLPAYASPLRGLGRRWFKGSRLLLPFFFLLAGALLASVILFVLPRARITVETTTEPLIADLTLFLDASAQEPSLDSLTHPARHVLLEEDVDREFPVETMIEKGNRAEGSVELVNRTDRPQGIKGRTRLQGESGIVILTQRDLILPSKGRFSVAVAAEKGGSLGNLEPQRLDMPGLPPASQKILYGELVRPLKGGTDRPVRELSEADVRRATERLRAEMEARLQERLRNREDGVSQKLSRSIEPDVLTLPGLSRLTIEDVRTSVPIGEAVEVFRVLGLARAEALTADRSAVEKFLRMSLRARAGEGKEVPPLDLAALRVVDVRWDSLRAQLTLHVETTLAPSLDLDGLKDRLRGRTPKDAASVLREIPGVKAVSVRLSPLWVTRVPENTRAIRIHREP